VVTMTDESPVIEKLKSKSISKCEKEWDITIVARAITEVREHYFKSIAPKAQVDGFRKGKVPIAILEQHFKDEARSEVVHRLLSRSVREAMEMEKEEIIHYPTVRDIQFEGDQLSFKLHIELRPKIKLPRYQGLKIKRPEFTVTEEEVTQIIDRMRERSATFAVVSERATQMDDFVVADYVLSIEGKECEKKSDEIFELKDEPMLPGFAKQVAGMKIGETRTITIDLPESFPRSEWAKKQAAFKFILKDIKEKKLPEADDDWAASVSSYKTLAEIREHIRKDLHNMKERENETAFEHSILDELIKQSKFDVPDSTVLRRVHYLTEQNVEHLVSGGHPQDKAEALTKEKAEELKKEAERQVRVALIFDEIAKLESITISDEALHKRIEELVSSSRNPEETASRLKDENRQDALRDQLRYEKVFDFLKSGIAKN